MDSLPEINLNTAKATAKKATVSLRSAGNLVAKKAEQTKLIRVTLPRAYAELGKAVFKDGSRRDEFGELFNAVDNLLAERKRIQDQGKARPAGTTMADKAKKVASDATDMARMKAIELQALQAFSKLGEAVYQQHGSEAGSSSVVEPIAIAVVRRDQLDREMRAINVSAKGKWITPKRIAWGVGVVVGLAVLGKVMDDGDKSESVSSTSSPVRSTDDRQERPPIKTTGTKAFNALIQKAQNNGFRVLNDMRNIRISEDLFRQKGASLLVKSSEEEDHVLLIAEVEPLEADNPAFQGDYAMRGTLKVLAWQMANLIIAGVSNAEENPLIYGVGSDGRQVIKTDDNGATHFNALVIVGRKTCEMRWVPANRVHPNANASLTTVSVDGKTFTTNTDGPGVDMRNSTLAAIRGLLLGGQQ